MKAAATRNWYGNSGTDDVVAEAVEGLLDVLEDMEVVLDVVEVALEAEDELAMDEVEDDVVEVVEVVDDSAASGTTETVELPLLATNTSPFPES